MKFLTSSIRNKIIIPYIFLTLIVGVAGAYFGTQLVFDTVLERLESQLINAARVAGQTISDQDQERLIVMRQILATQGFIEAMLAPADQRAEIMDLEQLLRAMLISSPNIDSIIILDQQANEIYGVRRGLGLGSGQTIEPSTSIGASYAGWSVVAQVLNQQRPLNGGLVQGQAGGDDILYSVSAIQASGQPIGVIFVGQYLSNSLAAIRMNSLAEVTFYDTTGKIRHSTLHTGSDEAYALESDFYSQVVSDLDRSVMDRVVVRGQEYARTFTPFYIHGTPIGLYSVGMITDFVTRSGNLTRNAFTVIIFIAITVLMIIALTVTRQIIRPLAQLVRTSSAIAAGDLNRETGIQTRDEIGKLAVSFDQMTAQLRRRTEQLEELVKLQGAILSSIADGVLVQDKAGNITQLNPAAERILEQLSQVFIEYHPTDHVQLAQRILQRLNKMPGSLTHQDDGLIKENKGDLQSQLSPKDARETPTRNFDIGHRSINTRAAPVITDNDEILGSVVVLRDITPEVAAERLKTSLIRSISHELLTPLVPMKGYLQLLEMTATDQMTSQQIEFIQLINKSAGELNDLISTLIDFVQIEAEGSLASDLEEFVLNDLVKDISCDIRERMRQEDLTFNLHPTQTPLPVEADRKRLKRVLSSLLDNAIKYNKPGGSVELRLTEENAYAQISVVDTGIGIDESLKPHLIKQPFLRAISGDDEIRGGGLGLYLAGKIIEAHHGKIWFESNGTGSLFAFEIPLATSAAEPEADPY